MRLHRPEKTGSPALETRKPLKWPHAVIIAQDARKQYAKVKNTKSP